VSPPVSGELTADPVTELRRQFDASFALPVRPPRPDDVDLLAVGVGDDRCAIRRDQIAGLATRPELTAVPGQLPALLGIATVRATTVAVYDLAALIGRPGTTRCRWMVLTAVDPTLALAFDRFDGHLRVPGGDPSRPFRRPDGTVIPVLDLPALVERLDDLIRLAPPQEEPRR
jgi:hypothetical protein